MRYVRVGVRYHQHTDDSQLYISTPGKINVAMIVLSKSLEAGRIWIVNKFQLNSDKTELLWVLGPTNFKTVPSLVLDGVVLSWTDPYAAWEFPKVHDCCFMSQWQSWLEGFCTFLSCLPVVPALHETALLTVTHS